VKPLLLLDVDGVLSPLVGGGGPEWFAHPGRWGTVLLNRNHATWLHGLRTQFDLVWATSREDDANADVGAPLGLPVLPVIEFSAAWDSERTWKLQAVTHYVGHRPFAWLDDEIHDDAHAWAAQHPAPVLLPAVDARVGFTAAHRDQLSAFAARL
jgi:hypothetical protein